MPLGNYGGHGKAMVALLVVFITGGLKRAAGGLDLLSCFTFLVSFGLLPRLPLNRFRGDTLASQREWLRCVEFRKVIYTMANCTGSLFMVSIGHVNEYAGKGGGVWRFGRIRTAKVMDIR